MPKLPINNWPTPYNVEICEHDKMADISGCQKCKEKEMDTVIEQRRKFDQDLLDRLEKLEKLYFNIPNHDEFIDHCKTLDDYRNSLAKVSEKVEDCRSRGKYYIDDFERRLKEIEESYATDVTIWLENRIDALDEYVKRIDAGMGKLEEKNNPHKGSSFDSFKKEDEVINRLDDIQDLLRHISADVANLMNNQTNCIK